MSRRDFLSTAQRLQLLSLPSDPRELARHYTFSASELAWICKRRREHNRLGFAVQLACFNLKTAIDPLRSVCAARISAEN